MTGETEDTDVGFPGPEHHIAERDWPMRWAMAVLGVRRDLRRAAPGPGRRRRDRQVPPRHVRRLAAVRASLPSTRPPTGRASPSAGRAVDRGIAARLLWSTSPAGHVGRADPRASGPSTRLPAQQVVLRRAVRRGHLPAADRDRQVRQRRRRAGRRPGDRRGGGRTWSAGSGWSSAAPSRASCAPTRCS